MKALLYFAMLAATLSTAYGSTPAGQPVARPVSREEAALRSRLQTVLNDAELALKRGRAHESSRHERDTEQLKVFERIPFSEERAKLERELKDSAKESGLKVVSVSFSPSPASAPAFPRVLYTDDPPFQPRREALARELPFTIRLSGDESSIRAWIRSWPDQVLRWVEPKAEPRKVGGTWSIDARAFVFRKLAAPEVRIRDPLALLPESARKDPARFARQEPTLWSLVSRIRELKPKADPLLKGRGQILLDRARLDFFVTRALAPS